ncbi:hypothetical protein HDU67_009514 [Dinochytrium kinnereticum]|nr:hypothetical protein HDU67_009514 [Dinochytrium kinnereticum]
MTGSLDRLKKSPFPTDLADTDVFLPPPTKRNPITAARLGGLSHLTVSYVLNSYYSADAKAGYLDELYFHSRASTKQSQGGGGSVLHWRTRFVIASNCTLFLFADDLPSTPSSATFPVDSSTTIARGQARDMIIFSDGSECVLRASHAVEQEAWVAALREMTKQTITGPIPPPRYSVAPGPPFLNIVTGARVDTAPQQDVAPFSPPMLTRLPSSSSYQTVQSFGEGRSRRPSAALSVNSATPSPVETGVVSGSVETSVVAGGFVMPSFDQAALYHGTPGEVLRPADPPLRGGMYSRPSVEIVAGLSEPAHVRPAALDSAIHGLSLTYEPPHSAGYRKPSMDAIRAYEAPHSAGYRKPSMDSLQAINYRRPSMEALHATSYRRPSMEVMIAHAQAANLPPSQLKPDATTSSSTTAPFPKPTHQRTRSQSLAGFHSTASDKPPPEAPPPSILMVRTKATPNPSVPSYFSQPRSILKPVKKSASFEAVALVRPHGAATPPVPSIPSRWKKGKEDGEESRGMAGEGNIFRGGSGSGAGIGERSKSVGGWRFVGSSSGETGKGKKHKWWI